MTGTNACEHDETMAEAGAAGDMRRLFTADIDIRIARDGTWYHEGRAIRRKPLVKLFASILKRGSDGEFYLETPGEKRRIVVEDAPFVAVEVTVSDGEVRFRTNVDDEIVADEEHPVRVVFDPETGEPAPYVMVRDGLEALIARSVYYELVNAGRLAECDGSKVLGIDSRGVFFVLGETGDEL
ncbi:MAG: DUF1285 domain-containing protein [Rhodospirillales bacterium]|nr:DUF1285 domain-containing protein [Rhodospirillales bacterium]